VTPLIYAVLREALFWRTGRASRDNNGNYNTHTPRVYMRMRVCAVRARSDAAMDGEPARKDGIPIADGDENTGHVVYLYI
jgi:hypothetical protein